MLHIIRGGSLCYTMYIYIRNEPTHTGSSFLPPVLQSRWRLTGGSFQLDRIYLVVVVYRVSRSGNFISECTQKKEEKRQDTKSTETLHYCTFYATPCYSFCAQCEKKNVIIQCKVAQITKIVNREKIILATVTIKRKSSPD